MQEIVRPGGDLFGVKTPLSAVSNLFFIPFVKNSNTLKSGHDYLFEYF